LRRSGAGAPRAGDAPAAGRHRGGVGGGRAGPERPVVIRAGAIGACIGLGIVSLAGVWGAGCAGPRGHAPAPVAVRPAVEAGPVIRNIEPWTFGGADGVIITTAHYRVFTTAAGSRVIQRLPAFLEDALGHYRSLGGVALPLRA